jgi:hypothetical protein
MTNKDTVTEKSEPGPQIGDVFPPWKEWSDRFTKFFSYLRTRRAIRKGSDLWQLPKADLESRRLLVSWQFNLYQSTLSALPSLILFRALYFVGLISEDTQDLKRFLGPEAIKYYGQISSYLDPFLVPVVLGIACSGAARGSLNPSDRSKERLARARRAYLYLNGAYGLWAQTIMVFGGTALSSREFIEKIIGVPVFFLLALFILIAVAWQNTITSWKIPRTLFRINGYDTNYPRAWFWIRGDSNSRQWRRYKLWTIFFVGVAAYAVHSIISMVELTGAILLSVLHGYLAGAH